MKHVTALLASIALFLLVLQGAPASAQTAANRAAVLAQANNCVVVNTTGQVTTSCLRATLQSIINSMATLLDTQTLLNLTLANPPTITGQTGYGYANGIYPMTFSPTIPGSAITTDSTLLATGSTVGVNLANPNLFTAKQTAPWLAATGTFTGSNLNTNFAYYANPTIGNLTTSLAANPNLAELFYGDVSLNFTAGAFQTNGLEIEMRENCGSNYPTNCSTGWTNVNGGINAIFTHAVLENPTALTNTNRNYTGGQFDFEMVKGDGGGATTFTGTNNAGATSVTVANGALWAVTTPNQSLWYVDDSGNLHQVHVSGVSGNTLTVASLPGNANSSQAVTNYLGGGFAMSAYTKVDAASTNYLSAGTEFDLELDTGSSGAYAKSASFVRTAASQASASLYDAGISIDNQNGAKPPKVAIMFSAADGGFTLDSTGCFICTVNPYNASYTVTTGIDLGALVTETGNAFNFKNGSWAGNGNITAPQIMGTANFTIGSTSAASANAYVDFTNSISSNTDQFVLFSNTPACTTCRLVVMGHNTTTAKISLYDTGVINAAGIITGVALGVTPTTWADNQTCVAGQIVADASYVYVCTATNTVKRATLATF